MERRAALSEGTEHVSVFEKCCLRATEGPSGLGPFRIHPMHLDKLPTEFEKGACLRESGQLVSETAALARRLQFQYGLRPRISREDARSLRCDRRAGEQWSQGEI